MFSQTFKHLFVCLLLFLIICNLQIQQTACHRSEVDIQFDASLETTTKKSGLFGGIKKFFRGSSKSSSTTTTTTTTASPNVVLEAKPTAGGTTAFTSQPGRDGPATRPTLVIPKAPLMPLQPRPDTPPSSPLAGDSKSRQPNWPQVGPNAQLTTPKSIPANFPNTPLNFPTPNSQTSKFDPYSTRKSQPSPFDLSYGGDFGPRKPSPNSPANIHPATIATTTTTAKPVVLSSTTARSQAITPGQIDLRMGDFVTTTTRKPVSSTMKEDFPALPIPRRPSITGSKDDLSTSSLTTTTSAPTVWKQPSTSTPQKDLINGNRVAFVPAIDISTTQRPETNTDKPLATDDEIRALTETMYTKEVNSQLNFVHINIQGKTRSIDSTDEAPKPLLEVDAKVFENPTIAKMRLLFNNYEMDTMVNEHVTAIERKEENDFVDAIMATAVMRQAMQFLQSKGLVTPDPKTHRDLVKELWFTQYSRGNGKIGSSGFEHVFVNEVKNGTIIGLHNWVYFYDEEVAGRLDYKGYIRQLDMGTKGKIMKVRFTHNGLNKPVNTMFIGTSPELEMALYTLCFQLRPDRTCEVSLGNNKFGIVTYSWRYRGKKLIGSAYPEI